MVADYLETNSLDLGLPLNFDEFVTVVDASIIEKEEHWKDIKTHAAYP